MDFLFCLAHFCEVHGPTPIICTQAILDSTRPDHEQTQEQQFTQVPEHDNLDDLLESSCVPSAGSSRGCASCSMSLPADDSVTVLRSTEKSIPTDGRTLVYLSTPNARSQARYAALRQVCMNSLSLDPFTSSSAVMFGDGQTGYAIALFFRIRDDMARGNSRSYALICMNDVETQLQECWSIVVPAFEDMVRWISVDADAARAAVLSPSASMTASMPTMPLGKGMTGQAEMSLPNILVDGYSPDRYLRRQHEPKPRNLVDLTGQKDIFVHIHLSFTVILSALCREIAKGTIRSVNTRF
ncbi:vesicle coat protein [Lipomyces arxii]|uniref:vesicle coat protein n=1 Tax=Lipomyces arxii TaxID=56418 RepID=UPI0034CDA59C